MIFSVSGKLSYQGGTFAVVESGGVGYKLFISAQTSAKLPPLGSEASLFTHLHVREDALDLYGFVSAAELRFFELLISVSGVGPKSALAVMDVADLASLSAAIQEGRPDLLTRAAGIGRKTAERVVLELKGKVEAGQSEAAVRKMDTDSDLAETLVGLGYRREEAKSALDKVAPEVTGIEPRLKEALKLLSKRK